MPSMRSAWVKIMKQIRAQSSTMLVIWNLDKGFFMLMRYFDGKVIHFLSAEHGNLTIIYNFAFDYDEKTGCSYNDKTFLAGAANGSIVY